MKERARWLLVLLTSTSAAPVFAQSPAPSATAAAESPPGSASSVDPAPMQTATEPSAPEDAAETSIPATPAAPTTPKPSEQPGLATQAVQQPTAAPASLASKSDAVHSNAAAKDGGYRPIWSAALDGRCALAWCTDQRWIGVEPIVEVPVGKSFGLDHSGVAKFINNQDVGVQFNLGLRVWLFYDWVSLAVYLSKSTFPSDSTIRVAGSGFEHSSAHVKRPYPGLALGLFADTLWLGFDIDELKNGSSDSSDRDPNFARNEVISRALTFNLSIAPVSIFRNGIGISGSGKKDAPHGGETAPHSEESKSESVGSATKADGSMPAEPQPSGAEPPGSNPPSQAMR